jgi:ubiquinone/menaquinone biosynthesis C-methylase UbiE
VNRNLLATLFAVLAFIAWRTSPPAFAEEPAQATEAPPALTEYMGRQIAQTMHFTGAEWLTRDTRENEERCSLMLSNLGVKRGQTVCDMGCGNGFYTIKMAKLVGAKGKVLAVDIQPEMLEMLEVAAKRAKVDKNIEPILGEFHDPKLPKEKVDLILCVDVYHEFSHPEQMLAAMRQSLAPGGMLVLVEFRAEDPEVPILPEHKMSKEQVVKELGANGFKLAKQFDRLPWQHMLWFARDDDETVEKLSAEKPTSLNAPAKGESGP